MQKILLLPLLGVIFMNSCKTKNDEKSLFANNSYLKIELLKRKVVEKNGIGNEWRLESFVNNHPLNKEIYILKLTGLHEVIIQSKAIEDDPNHDDIGTNRLIITPEDTILYKVPYEIVEKVYVKEKYGNGAGKTATCSFTYKVFYDVLNSD